MSEDKEEPKVIGWCMRCKKKTEMKDPVEDKTKKGVKMMRGVCSVCGTKMCRMGG